jgi:hypothetical protein
LDGLARDIGLSFDATASKPTGEALKLRPVRVGLWDRYGGSMESGHIRWMFEKAFPRQYELAFAPRLDAGDLKNRYDVLIFPDGGLPGGEGGRGGRGGGGGGRGGRAANIPDEYKDQVGAVTLAQTGPLLKKFVEDGGTLLAIGNSTGFASYLNIPVTNALVENNPDGPPRRLPNTKFYIPGSVLRASVNNRLPIAYGLPAEVDVFYQNSPAFRLLPGAEAKGTRSIAWFASAEPLRSGWAWGEQYLNGAVAAVESDLGKGKVYLFGPEITFRGQPHGTFKFLFNAIDLAGATPVTLD